MRRSWIAAVLAVATSTAPARADGAAATACAVRLRISHRTRAVQLESALRGLETLPAQVQPLLAGSNPELHAVAVRRDRPTVASLIDAALRETGPGEAHGMAAWYVLRFADAATCSAALSRLQRTPGVEAAEPVRDLHLCELPVAGAAATAAVGEVPWNVRQVRAPEALASIVPDSSLIVAIVDTGADLTHPDLVRRIWRNSAEIAGNGLDDDGNGYIDDVHGYDFTDAPGSGGVGDYLDRDADPSDDQGHGTHLAGIVAADGTLRGVAPFVRLMPVRAGYTTAFGGGVLQTDDAAAAIVYAADNGARVLNLSWGDTEESRLVREAVAYASAHGVVVVAAAGNNGREVEFFPASDPGVISVAAVERDGSRAAFSNFGSGIELAAPGEERPFPGAGIVSLAPGGGRVERRGTSMAAPHVAGVAALVFCRADRPSADRVRALLSASARRSGPDDWTPDLGHGIVDALAAVQSRDDLVLAVRGPARPYHDGRLLLVGTVLGGDLVRYRAEARYATGQRIVSLAPWRSGAVVADTLVNVSLAGEPEGSWEYVVQAETGDGRRREKHGSFDLDRTAPQVDTLRADSAWRGAEARWLVTAKTDDAVDLCVRGTSGDTLIASDAGFSRRVQVESRARPGTGELWRARLTNASGLATDVALTAPSVLESWPQGGSLTGLDSTHAFWPESVWGAAPQGGTVVWGRGLVADTLTTMQAWGVTGDRLVLRHDTGRVGRPVGFADVNGDGTPDLLYQIGSQIVWLVTRGAASYPDSVATIIRTERALGLFQLDADAPYEAILARSDTLLLYGDAAHGEPQLLQTLANPARGGFNVWGADAAVGDLDSDGRLDIACGDAEGNLSVFAADAAQQYHVSWSGNTGGVYAYDLTALPEGGVLVGRERSKSVTGDGFPTTSFDFLAYGAAGGSYAPLHTDSFLCPTGELQAASAAALSPSGESWLALVRGPDLYMLRGSGAARRPAVYRSGAAGEAPALADFDADGALELVLRTPQGARLLRLDEPVLGPHDLTAESQGATRLLLQWSSGTNGNPARLRRARDGVWQTVADVSGTSWIDSTVVTRVRYEYEVQGLLNGSPRGVSNRVAARAQPRPQLEQVALLGPASVRLRFSNALRAEVAEPRRFRVRRGDGVGIRVVQVTLASQDREAQLFLEAPAPCGTLEVEADSLRDDQGGLLSPPVALTQIAIACSTAAFFVRRAQLEGDTIGLEFSRAPDSTALDVHSYILTWQSAVVPMARIDRLDATHVRLVPGPDVHFLGRGVPYTLHLDARLRAAGDGAALTGSGEILLRPAGSGAARLFAYPNPARGDATEVVFAEAAADTRVQIFDLEGQLVRELRGGIGGGLRWDLRGTHGRRVEPGVYLYVASDRTGTKRGSLAIVR